MPICSEVSGDTILLFQLAGDHATRRIRRGQTKVSWTFDAGADPETLWVEYAAN
jgi:hypothetical protein